ncbi:exported hypothetical protein [Nitrospina gracilis 3/211]|uniref:Secreted protein n=1 Tax=Nitrospina gracilis (strain 3/211) TaxID=1266370 RepID=M1YW08_NITG3|nr:exported hypothetical protein [Nitrospina gracilis 3/211]
MLKRIVTGILVTGGVLLLFAAQAVAAPHAHEGVNPFASHASSTNAEKPHCPQHGHHLLILCPHANRAGATHPVDCQISRDCGEHPRAVVTGGSPLPPMERIVGPLTSNPFLQGASVASHIASYNSIPPLGLLPPLPGPSDFIRTHYNFIERTRHLSVIGPAVTGGTLFTSVGKQT